MNDHHTSAVTAFVVAGGKSTRMGRDKAFLELEGETLLARALRLAGAVAGEVRIVGGAKKFGAYGRVVEDVYRDRGPLGGIHAALLSTTTELNLILGVDLPLVEPRFLQYLILQAHESGAMVTVPRAGGGLQPLCAVYRKSFSSIAEQALRQGNNKIDALFVQVKTHVMEEGELNRLGFAAQMFRNLNTPEDWKQVEQESIRSGKSDDESDH